MNMNMFVTVLRDSYATILCTIIIICTLIINRKKYNHKVIILFEVTVLLTLIESVSGSIERAIANGPAYHPMRLVLSWVCYIVGPGILLSVAETIMRNAKPWKRWLIAIPEMINVLVTSTAFVGPWCFSFDKEINHFMVGPLIGVPRGSIIVYLVIDIVVSIIYVRRSKRECVAVLLGAVLIALDYLDEVEFGVLQNAREVTMAVTILTYFMYFISEQHIDEVIEFHEEKQKNEDLLTKKMLDQSIETLAYTIDAKDQYTRGHSFRVAKYAKMIAQLDARDDEECRQIYLTGLLHDIGKISIDDAIINKKGRLTAEEFEVIKTHSANGAKILEKMKDYPFLQDGAAYHHERYDGKGYPNGLKGEDIPNIARIIAVADSYDAMTSHRSYRNVMAQADVKQEIWKGVGTQFDPIYAKLMLSLIDSDVDYNMREKADIDDAGFLETDKAEIVWETVVPEGIKVENQLMNETNAFMLGRFAAIVDNWMNPSKGVFVGSEGVEATFTAKMETNTKYLWYVPAIVVYHSEDGTVDSDSYDELGVFIAYGYSWRSGEAISELSTLTKTNQFESWDHWVDRNREGMKYQVSVRKEGATLHLVTQNELLKVEGVLNLPEGYDKDIYISITGERCTISDLKFKD
ncbi:MAG: HD-GYP domain-containing protein [Lachnospiraceae bacterium]|nr:HD-GYP domain-containing protein [Lachnospiraceae bacterium]